MGVHRCECVLSVKSCVLMLATACSVGVRQVRVRAHIKSVRASACKCVLTGVRMGAGDVQDVSQNSHTHMRGM